MSHAQIPHHHKSGNGSVDRVRDDLRETIEHAAHFLPAQGPITVFVHHNTLHFFESLEFDEGVQAGGKLFGCHAYLPEDDYRRMLERGRMAVVAAAALNGIAILQAYFLIFTGKHHSASFSLRARLPERIAVLILAALIIGGGIAPQWGVASRYRAATELIRLRGGSKGPPQVVESTSQKSHAMRSSQARAIGDDNREQ